MNGYAVAQQEIVADGTARPLQFGVPIRQSSWIAARILPSSRTNPIFVVVGGKHIRASRRSAQWCLGGVSEVLDSKGAKNLSKRIARSQEGL